MGGGAPPFGGLKIVFPRESMKCNLAVFQRCHSFWRRNARRSEHDHEATSTQVKKRSLPVKGWRSLWLEGEKVIETELDKGRNHQLESYCGVESYQFV